MRCKLYITIISYAAAFSSFVQPFAYLCLRLQVAYVLANGWLLLVAGTQYKTHHSTELNPATQWEVGDETNVGVSRAATQRRLGRDLNSSSVLGETIDV